ncbi:MAG: hypothetical protein HFH33_13635 [Eubacterium sp.]|nr:hypothetical protein [Eubacterium sp.]
MELVEQIKSIDGVRAVRVLKSATAVVPASYMVFTNFNRYQIPFAFPIVKTVFLFMLIILICVTTSLFVFSRSKKETIIELLRKNEI